MDAGRRTVKVDPWPHALSTWISPPIIVQNARLMARPSPVPPYLRVVEESACVNGGNSFDTWSGVMRMREPRTENTIQLPPSTRPRRPPTVTAPCEVTLAAFVGGAGGTWRA